MKNLKRIKIVLIILVLFISSCTPKELKCNCWVEESYTESSNYTASDITDCSRNGELLDVKIEGTSGVYYILRCQ